MSFNLLMNFKTFKDSYNFVRDKNKFKIWKIKQEKKKAKHPENEITEQYNFTDDKKGLHPQHYHNQVKIYKSEHPE